VAKPRGVGVRFLLAYANLSDPQLHLHPNPLSDRRLLGHPVRYLPDPSDIELRGGSFLLAEVAVHPWTSLEA
jgi:hypothetical protein